LGVETVKKKVEKKAYQKPPKDPEGIKGMGLGETPDNKNESNAVVLCGFKL